MELVSGSISLPSAQENTLDEPVSTTIVRPPCLSLRFRPLNLRDLRLVGGKLRVVLIPSHTSEETLRALRDWDLWGPLLLCLTLSIMLSVTAPTAQSAIVFTGVFIVIWVGAAIVTINAQLLGSSMYVGIYNLHQCLSLILMRRLHPALPLDKKIVFSECMCPRVLRLPAEYRDIDLYDDESDGLEHFAARGHRCGRFSVTRCALLLRSNPMLISPFLYLALPTASVVFMSKLVPPQRKALTVYPVLLFYLFISWMVLMQ
ncbi:hypothetical protein PsorP6_016432 [Peronosclerospora sorghi]|uniref:Uncharacterized protein n=1 Tax=Peronosclerospora sorghi TaxID=230839 RepID=A0ACC0VPF3_9STRA|nr:hypothetical protein PsorP6_016432 [Peronosclerospora sorghi]